MDGRGPTQPSFRAAIVGPVLSEVGFSRLAQHMAHLVRPQQSSFTLRRHWRHKTQPDTTANSHSTQRQPRQYHHLYHHHRNSRRKPAQARPRIAQTPPARRSGTTGHIAASLEVYTRIRPDRPSARLRYRCRRRRHCHCHRCVWAPCACPWQESDRTPRATRARRGSCTLVLLYRRSLWSQLSRW